jgi:hypothetical protein
VWLCQAVRRVPFEFAGNVERGMGNLTLVSDEIASEPSGKVNSSTDAFRNKWRPVLASTRVYGVRLFL